MKCLDFWASQLVLVGRNLSANVGDVRDAGSIPGSGRSSRGGHGNPLRYPCLVSPMGRGAWRATFYRVAKSQTWLKQLSMPSTFRAPLVKLCRPALWSMAITCGYFIFFWDLLYYLFIFFDCAGSSLLHVGFLWLWLVVATLHCGVQASHCSGFSCCGAQILGTWASVTVARGLSSCSWRALECWLSSCGAWA